MRRGNLRFKSGGALGYDGYRCLLFGDAVLGIVRTRSKIGRVEFVFPGRRLSKISFRSRLLDDLISFLEVVAARSGR